MKGKIQNIGKNPFAISVIRERYHYRACLNGLICPRKDFERSPQVSISKPKLLVLSMPRIPPVEKRIDLKLAERAEGKRENEKPLLFILFSSLEKEETFFV